MSSLCSEEVNELRHLVISIIRIYFHSVSDPVAKKKKNVRARETAREIIYLRRDVNETRDTNR